MTRSANFCSLLALGAMLGLAGCGGSGGAGTSATLPAPVNSNPAPDTDATGEAVTISGKVTDMPIANARVVITVGDRSFEAPATTDSEGNFTVEIRADDPEALVLMEAFDPATGIHFTALLDDFGGFRAAADADGVVRDKDITNVTTAHYVLAREATDDRSIDDLEELDQAAEVVDAEAVLELSAAIKLVVENLSGVTLPTGIDDTQELAEAIISGQSTFLDEVALLAPDALNDAVDLVLSDGHATLKWDAERVPGVYVHREGYSLYAMYADGTGTAASFERDLAAGFQWTVNDAGKLLVAWDSGEGQDAVTLLSRHRNVLKVMVEERDASGAPVRGEPSTVRYFPFAERGFTNDNVPGTYSTMDEPGHVKVFLADHNGYDLDLRTGEQRNAFAWEVDAAGMLHIADTGGVLRHQARVLGGAADDGLHLLVNEYDAAGATTHVDVITVRHSDTVATTPGEVSDRDLRLAGSAYAALGDGEIAMFRFRADGELREVSQRETSTGAELTDRRGAWTMIDDQTLRTRFDDSDMPEDVRLIEGVGAEQMFVQTPEDIAAGTERVATRIDRVEPDAVVGGFYLLDETGARASEFVQLNADFTGVHMEDGVIDEQFEWSIDENGAIVVTIDRSDRFADETITLYLLAGGSAAEMRFIAVHRFNGRLDADDERGRALSVVHFWREG